MISYFSIHSRGVCAESLRGRASLTSYLKNEFGVIQCCKCGTEFGFPKHWLSLPGKLLEMKKDISAAHECYRSKARVWQAPTTSGQLAHYYSQAMRRATA